MPKFALTRQQRQAFESLRWLHSRSEMNRRSGRTYVLALHYVWRCLHSSDWVEIEDHHEGSRENSQSFVRQVMAIAQSMGVTLEWGRAGRVRLEHSTSFPRDVLTQFDDFDDFTFSPRPQNRQTPTKPELPTSIWDLLLKKP